MERLGKHQTYPIRELRPFREWWKIHILPQHDVKRANVACFDNPLRLDETMRFEYASKWEAATFAKIIQISHSQWTVGIGYAFEGLQESSMQIGVQCQEECFGPNRKA